MEALSPRETEVAERIAWGASQKEVADQLGISRFTVDNIIRKIYGKLWIGKINELSAWWFCTHFNISFDLSPLHRKIIATAFLVLLVSAEVHFSYGDDYTLRRPKRFRTITRARKVETFVELIA